MKWLAKILVRYFKWHIRDRGADFIIRTYDQKPYMLRWWIIPRNKWFNIYLHKVVGDDDKALHDHPWNSLGLILEGAYKEITPVYQPVGKKLVDRRRQMEVLGQGRWKYRDTDYAHYLTKASDEPVWTLFFTFKRKKAWGFYNPDSLQWVDNVTWCINHGKEVTYD